MPVGAALAERFHADLRTAARGAVVTLDPSESRHLVRVMRAAAGAPLRVFGGGREFAAVLRKADASAAVVELLDELPVVAAPRTRFVAAVPWLKSGNTEFLVEKLCELGVAGIVVFRSRREVAHGDASRVAKLNRTALEACKQCGRADVPRVTCAESPAAAVAASGVASARALVMYEQAAGLPLSAAVAAAGEPAASPWLLASGPEGGFHPDEVAAVAVSATVVTLGPRILRAETAPLAAAGALLALGGDL